MRDWKAFVCECLQREGGDDIAAGESVVEIAQHLGDLYAMHPTAA